MVKTFGVYFDFSLKSIHRRMDELLLAKQRATVGVVDATVLSMTYKDEYYRRLVNSNFVNICDGTTIAKIAGCLHHKKYEYYNGPDFFKKYVAKSVKQVLIGNTPENHRQIAEKLHAQNADLSKYLFIPLPFQPVEQFDYKAIAKQINQFEADIVWISLGAPKQEIFMSLLVPRLYQGVVVPVGAAFNFYVDNGGVKRAPKWMRTNSLEWLYRLFEEPKKQAKRLAKICRVYPRLIWMEYTKSK